MPCFSSSSLRLIDPLLSTFPLSVDLPWSLLRPSQLRSSLSVRFVLSKRRRSIIPPSTIRSVGRSPFLLDTLESVGRPKDHASGGAMRPPRCISTPASRFVRGARGPDGGGEGGRADETVQGESQVEGIFQAGSRNLEAFIPRHAMLWRRHFPAGQSAA